MIPDHKPLELEFEISAEVMQGNVEKKSQFIPNERFEKPVQCKVELNQKSRAEDVELNAEISGEVTASCYRCSEEFTYPCEGHYFVVCAAKEPEPRRGKRSIKEEERFEEESQEGLAFFEGEEMDLAKIIRENILIGLPMRYLCEEACKGLCGTCGDNLNTRPHEHTKK